MLALRDSFSLATLRAPEKRAAMKEAFVTFERAYPEDPQVPLARVYLAFIALADTDLAHAKTYLDLLEPQPRGWVRDFSLIASARYLRLQGNPTRALELLRPLRGKFVDRQALSLFLEEVAVSALGAGDEPFAIERISEWIAYAAPEEQDDVRARVDGLLSSFHVDALEVALGNIRKGKFQTSQDLARMITERLAVISVETNDIRLARWLAEAEVRSETSEINARLHELASREQETVRGRTIGLLLSTGQVEIRDMAAEAARGVAWALGLPRNRLAAEQELRLVTRDDGGKIESTEAGLDELAGIGASVIIAAFDEPTADRAIAWAEKAHVAVITLALPKKIPAKLEYGFIAGEGIEPSIGLLVDALAKDGRTKIAPITDRAHIQAVGQAMTSRTDVTFFQPTACEAREDGQGLPREEWEKKGFRTWLLAGADRCARDMLRTLGTNSTHAFGLALDAIGPVTTAKGVRTFAVGAGSLPVVGTPPADIAEFSKSFGSTPDWTTALGRDAALLASRAIAALPTDESNVANVVIARRLKMRDALVSARSRLWTSDESGFTADHRIKRTLHVVSLSDDPAKKRR